MYYTFLSERKYIMSDFIINGGKPLRGQISAGGSKNAVLPIIFATIAAKGISVIENVPDISDVDTALLLIKELGGRVERSGTTLRVDTRSLRYKPPNPEACCAIRASTYLMGAELARFGRTEISAFGGCSFEPRPIDLHIFAAECMGAFRKDNCLYLKSPKSSEIHFKKISVGATANAMILAASLPIQTHIYGYASEPHIKTLSEFLIFAGAKIEFTEDKIEILGTALSGAHIRIPPDPVETGTYALLSLLFGGGVRVSGAPLEELSALTEPLFRAGAQISENASGFCLFGELKEPVSLSAAPYPALATDLQPLTVPVLAAFSGGFVRDTVFPDRFGYVNELSRFGIRTRRCKGAVRVLPSKIHSAEAIALDLRGGASLLFPALLASGESRVSSAELIKRGYGGIAQKLTALGADIREEAKKE